MTVPLVVLVSHSSRMYGAERSLLTLATGLRDRGSFAPVVLLPRRGPLVTACEDEGIPAQVTPYYHWIGVGKRLLRTPVSAGLNRVAVSRAPKTFAGIAPDLVYTNTLATPFGAQLARRLRVPHVWHVREFVEDDMGAEFDFGLARSLRFVERRSDRVICNSEAVKRKFAQFIPNARVIHNGIAFDADTPRCDDRHARTAAGTTPRLVMAGSVHPGKGHEDAIRALAALRRAGHGVRLDVVGSGQDTELERLRARAPELGVADAIDWTGYVDDVRPHLAAAAAVLVCSRCEAFGRIAVEAMAAGAPVVAADAGGLPEVVCDGETGLLYPPGNPDALAAAVTRLLADPELHDTIARRGYEAATSRFTVAGYVSGVEDVLAEALGVCHT